GCVVMYLASHASCFAFGRTGSRGISSLPRNRYVLPSTRSAPINEWFRPVQCFTGESNRRSDIDQALVYGSIVTSGYAGARNETPDSIFESGVSVGEQE